MPPHAVAGHLALAVWAEQAGSTLYEESRAGVCSFALLATALVVLRRVLAPESGAQHPLWRP
ncbi:hypothetical protein ACI2LC_05540 [Nonomuraea wenchangensis]|uniref:hypothetical protein n=1 Tax=Nonomuraea wenchangensis TaxID=568860 RepID=UPI0033BFF94F